MGSRSLGKEFLQCAIARNFDRPRRDAGSIGAVAALCAALGLSASHRADAANTYFVTNAGDSGAGTLRKAIADASAAGSGNTVMFDAGLVGSTITLTSDYILIDKPMYIHGPGANLLTISGGHQSRIFYVKTDTQADGVRISGVTLTAGNAGTFAGGAVAAKNSILGLYYSTVTDSAAGVGGGIFATNGVLEVASSRVSGNTAVSVGGGISVAYSTFQAAYSTISGNTAGTYGGGIYARDTGPGSFFTAFRSTISGNRIPQPAGLASVGGGGIALVRATSDSKVISSTVATNYAFQNGGGIAVLDAASASYVEIVDATIASNSSAASSGNGISAKGASAVETLNTIVSGNFSASGLSDLSGTFLLTNCLVQETAGATVTGTSSGNLFGVDPHLSGLADHGGPTLTLLPGAASAAVDALGCDVEAFPFPEQRNYTRCVNGARDIGAVERQNPENIIFRNGLEPI